MPTTTNGAGDSGTPGAIGASNRQTDAPRNAPIIIPGPKMPPEPPDPIESEVARILAKGRARTIQRGIPSS